jgi:hypothetical protein
MMARPWASASSPHIRDVERFLDFAERTYRDPEPDGHGLPPRLRCLPARVPRAVARN